MLRRHLARLIAGREVDHIPLLIGVGARILPKMASAVASRLGCNKSRVEGGRHLRRTTLQGHYAAWLEALPENLQDSATAEALQAICDLDLTELQAIVPPRGFGRD